VTRVFWAAFVAGIMIACPRGNLWAGDWPMWRCDAARSGAAPEGIAADPVLLWTRKLPPVRQAWPFEANHRLDFDASYEPVVMGKLLLLGSPNDGGVTAYDTETGRQRWKFYSEGPVRCAPACWKGRVYAGSDDGYLYCLDAESGRLVWKVRGAPAERPDRRQLGNGHLVSFWPVRGGPVVANGVVYFGAGIWPVFGVFLKAVDAETGKAKWSNGELNCLADVRCEHSELWETAVSPQGHIGLIRDRLIVPCGRAFPAGLDAATGRLIYFDRGWRKGDCRVASHGDYAFVGANAMVSLKDFCELGSRWGMYQAQQRAKMIEGCDAWSAFENGFAYGSSNGTFYAYDIAHARIVEREQLFYPWGDKIRTLKFEPPVLWQLRAPQAGPEGRLVIKAGPRLYGHVGKRLVAVDNLQGEPRIAWEKQVAAPPTSLAAADNKLFMATADALYCFGDAESGAHHTKNPLQSPSVFLDDVSGSFESLKAVRASDVRSGYCLLLGIPRHQRLIDELLHETDLIILAVDADAETVATQRREFDAAGLLGSRVQLFTGDPLTFGFPPYIASLIVPGVDRFLIAANAERLLALLRPYGGTLYLGAGSLARLEAWAKAARTGEFTVKHADRYSFLVRSGPPAGSAPWTHAAADAANTYCSQDDLVKPPLGVLWYGDVVGSPTGYVPGLEQAVNSGRVYTLHQHPGQAVLFAYDAYTGRFLWKTDIVGFTCAAAMADGVYAAANGGKCFVYDPETGKASRTFGFDTAGARYVKDIRVEGDVIVVACSRKHGLWPDEGSLDSTVLIALDRRNGVPLWRQEAQERFNNRTLAIGQDKLFCVDSITVPKAKKASPAGLKEIASTVVAFDIHTGAKLWSTPLRYDATRKWTPAELAAGRSHANTEGYADDWLAYSAETGTVLTGRFLLGSAFEAGSGKPLWRNKEIRGAVPLVVRGKTIVASGGAVYDILTGEPIPGRHAPIHRSGCGYALGGVHLVFRRDSSACYYDLEQDTAYHLRAIRSGCNANLIPADGLLNAPGFSGCICNFPIQTSFAMMHMPEVAAWATKPLRATPPPAKPGKERPRTN
jgi:outer membrane protein assembly factor BamB